MKINKSIALFILLFFISCDFAPGSYPYVETYEIRGNEAEVVKIIERFKIENQDYNVPKELNLLDGRSDRVGDHWYHIYFYYKDTNKIINTWLRQAEGNKTTFALVAINDGLQLGNWKRINKDFSRKENIQEKEKFTTLIVDKVQKMSDNK